MHIKLTEDEILNLDEFVKTTGFKNRSDFVQSLLYVATYGAGAAAANDPNPSPETLAWIERLKENSAEEFRIETVIMATIRRLAHAIIAMRGLKVAINNTADDIRDIVYEETGRYLSPEAIESALNAYAAIYKVELDNYRQDIANERYAALLAEKQEIEEVKT